MSDDQTAPTDSLPRDVADFIVELFQSHRVEHVFFNPGSSFRPLQDALIGQESPNAILCLNEGTAVAAASGYAMASGYERAGVALVHGLPGLLQAAVSVYNASAGNVPLVLLSGVTPAAPSAKMPFYDWSHSAPYQDSMLGDVLKWFDSPSDPEAISVAARRAFKIALSEPTGPVHLAIGSDALRRPAPQGIPGIPLAIPKLGIPDPVALRETAERLLSAAFPVVHTQALGRKRGAVVALQRLAELVGIAVDPAPHFFVNFPSDHAMSLFGTPDLYDATDLVLAIDTIYPPKTSAPIISVTSDPSHVSVIQPPIPAEDELVGDAERTLLALVEVCQGLLSECPDLVEKAANRKSLISEWHDWQREQWQGVTAKHLEANPISPRRLAVEIEAIRQSDTILVHQSVEMSPSVKEVMNFSTPGTGFFCSGASAYGWAAGAALGVKLAAPNQAVIALVGDGELGYNTAALYTAVKYGLGILFVVANNRSYSSQRKGFTSIGRHAVQSEWDGEGIDLDTPPIDWARIAEGYGLWATRVDDPEALGAALREAWAHVSSGRPALVDAVIRRGIV